MYSTINLLIQCSIGYRSISISPVDEASRNWLASWQSELERTRFEELEKKLSIFICSPMKIDRFGKMDLSLIKAQLEMEGRRIDPSKRFNITTQDI
jgi:hypothetical protein